MNDPEDDEDDGDGELGVDWPLIMVLEDDGPDDYWGD